MTQTQDTEPTITLSLEIENHYELYGQIDTTATITVPAPPEGDRDEWEYDFIYAETGTGREDGNSSYFVTVTASSDETLVPVGTEYEFGL